MTMKERIDSIEVNCNPTPINVLKYLIEKPDNVPFITIHVRSWEIRDEYGIWIIPRFVALLKNGGLFIYNRRWEAFQLRSLENTTNKDLIATFPDIKKILVDFLLLYVPVNYLTADLISDCRHLGLRRKLIDIYGRNRFFQEADVQIVDQSGSSRLLQQKHSEESDFLIFVEVVDSTTGALYYLPVPPTITRCKDAVAWTFGLDAKDYLPLIET